jgi:hypothetical protein
VTSGQGTATESGGRWPWTPSRCGNGPQVMATLRNLAIAIFKLAGTTNFAAAKIIPNNAVMHPHVVRGLGWPT